MAIFRLLLVIVSCAFQHILVTQPTSPKLSSKDKVHGPVRGLNYFLIFQDICIWSIAAGETIAHLLSMDPSESSEGIWGKSHVLFIPYNGSRTENFGKITTPFVIGVVLSVFSGWLRNECYHSLGRLYTFQHTTRQDHTLITSGPYAYVRHPAYTSTMSYPFMSVLVGLSSGSWLKECGVFETYAIVRYTYSAYLVLISIITVGLMIRAGREDNTLRDQFGKDWEVYAKKVPYRFIPYIV